MKKMICLVITLLLCASLVVPAFAAEDSFVPSITYKPDPEIVEIQGEDGNGYIGVIRNEDGEIVDYVGEGCLVITPIADVWDEEIEVPQDTEDLLLLVYDALKKGTMILPYEKHDESMSEDNMVIRDLIHIEWGCEEHRKLFEQGGYTLELIFDLGVMEDVQLFVMTYDEETEDWDPIVDAVNNGDGSVTFTFDRLGVIELSMPISNGYVPSDDVQQPNILPWILALAGAGIAAILILILILKKKKSAA